MFVTSLGEMKLPRQVLEEIAKGRKATRAEIEAMAKELVAQREDEERRDDGTVAVHIEHAGKAGIAGWFAPRPGRIPRSRLHVGGRVTMGGRVYSIVSIEGEDQHTVRVR